MNEVLDWFAISFFLLGLFFLVGGDHLDSNFLILIGTVFLAVSFIFHWISCLMG